MSVPDHIKHDEALSTVWSAMHQIAPLSLADSSWDNVGVLLQAPSPELNKGRKIMLAIDLTTEVVDEALRDGHVAVMLVYHPIIFRALKSITMNNTQQKSLLRLAAANISVYTPHTSLDIAPGGINDWLAAVCSGTDEISAIPIQPSKNAGLQHEKGSGMGRLVDLNRAKTSILQLVERVKRGTMLQYVQVACPSSLDRRQAVIGSIAICAGSGSSVLNGTKADAYVTGEMSHHEILACVEQGIVVVLTNHSNSERGYLSQALQSRLESVLQDLGKDYTVCVSKADRDPLEVM